MPQHASDFKLLAIKPLKNCDRKYCNNLLPDTLYQFYQDYNFSPNEGPISNIRITNTHYNIYNDYVQNGRDLKINVSAIVGKNGSGKSSLVELFYLCAYLVASVNDLLPINERAPSGKRQANDLHRIEETLKAEVYYQAKGKYHCIILDRDYNLNPRSASDSNIRFYDLFGGDRVPLAEFFYTVAVNYSIYGLNESITGTWLGRLFHKNDGYQTPIVLNPFRDQGTINVNGEMLFAQTRLLSNIRFDEHGVNEILPGKGVKEIVFIIDKQKLKRPEGHSNKRIFEELESRTGKQRNEIFDLIYTAMLGEKPDYNSIAQDEWREMSIDYVVTKVIRIAKKYPEYRSFYAESSEEQVPALSEVEPYLDELKKDMTHITLKLRQALNFFRNDPLRLDDDRIRRSISKITMQADLFAERYRKNCAKYPERDPMEFVPLAPFTPTAILEDGEDFYRMSSGEQQFVHSVQSVLYHILNLDSVFKYRGIQQKVTYNTINIIFDEIELYFHPEYQRKFVAEILKRISELNTPNIRFINLLFLTHSPFILSDIPSVNVLHLENGHVQKGQPATFAANIHQMLSNSFFMKSTIGDYAKFQYESIIRFYERVRAITGTQSDWETTRQSIRYTKKDSGDTISTLKQEYDILRKKFSFVISQIGEPVINGILKNHIAFIHEKFGIEATEELSAEKQRLEEQLKAINQKLNSGR